MKSHKILLWVVSTIAAALISIFIASLLKSKPRVCIDYMREYRWDPNYFILSVDNPGRIPLENLRIYAQPIPAEKTPCTLDGKIYAMSARAKATIDSQRKNIKIECDSLRPNEYITYYFSWTNCNEWPYETSLRVQVVATGGLNFEHYFSGPQRVDQAKACN